MFAKFARSLAPMVLLVAACGGGSSAGPGPDGATDPGGDGGGPAGPDAGGPAGPDAGPGGPDAGAPVLPATRFEATAATWAAPDNGLVAGLYDPAVFADYQHWTLTDLDGDGLPDLVHTGDPAFAQRVWDAAGAPYWKVFLGTGAGWAASAIDWSVPGSGQAGGFFSTDVTNGLEWRTVDLDGDGRPDLVHTEDPATGTVWDANGAPHWKLYRNLGGAFATTATLWPVPGAGTPLGFHRLVTESGPRWTTLDLDGDGRPDLIQTSDPATGEVWDAGGAPHWKVFLNTGAGFAAAAVLWPVPDSGTSFGFYGAGIESGGQRWQTFDLDGDGLRDLVQTADPATSRVWDAAGAPHWKLFRNTGAGFAATTSWPVPGSGLSDGFYRTASATSQRHWLVVDLDGDGALDLVQTGDSSHEARVWDAAGSPYWKLFRNTGSGFATDLHRFGVPTSGTSSGFYTSRASVGTSHWALVDADGDGVRDLIQTADPATSRVWDAAGSPYWKIYRARP